MDAHFWDLVLWVLLPLAILFNIWALTDCLGSPARKRSKVLYGLLIIILPFWGALVWFRSKTSQRSDESPLMRRVRQRRATPSEKSLPKGAPTRGDRGGGKD